MPFIGYTLSPLRIHILATTWSEASQGIYPVLPYPDFITLFSIEGLTALAMFEVEYARKRNDHLR